MGRFAHDLSAPNWCKRGIRNHDLKSDLGAAVEDDGLSPSTTKVIGRWLGRFGVILSSAKPSSDIQL
jgi:hypothetical protein